MLGEGDAGRAVCGTDGARTSMARTPYTRALSRSRAASAAPRAVCPAP